jgi:O-antigen/teichoic acid export membrane protein
LKKLYKIAGDTVLYGASTILGRLINWFLMPFYIRTLLQDEYGVVVNIYSFIAVLLVVNTLGFETGYFRFVKEFDTKKVRNSLISGIAVVSVFFISFTIILLPRLSSFFSGIENIEWIIILAVLIVMGDSVNSIPFAQFRYQNKAVKYSVFRLLQIILTVLFNLLYLVLFPYLKKEGVHIPEYIFDEKLRVFYVFWSNFLATFIILLIFIPGILRDKFSISKKILVTVFNYSFPIVLVGLFGILNQNIDKILLPYLINSDDPFGDLAIYGANFKIGVLMALFTQSFRLAFEPFFFKEGKNKDSKEIYSEVLKYFTFFGMLIFLGVMMFLDIINIILTPKYAVGNIIIPFILMSQLFFGIYYSLSLWYKLTDRTIFGFYMSLTGFIVNLAGLIILIPLYGYLGAAVSLFISFGLIMVISYLLGQRYYPVNYPVGKIIFLMIAGVLFYLFDTKLSIESVYTRYLVKGVIFATYILLFYLMEKFSKTKLKNDKGQNS